MCDLWKNTTNETVPVGSIPRQIEFALENLPTVQHIKLYNSGNFFDPRAIPVRDYQAIAAILSGFKQFWQKTTQAHGAESTGFSTTFEGRFAGGHRLGNRPPGRFCRDLTSK